MSGQPPLHPMFHHFSEMPYSQRTLFTATLMVFAVPAALLFPLKLLAIWFIAHEQWLFAFGTIVFAKLLGLGVTSFLFTAAMFIYGHPAAKPDAQPQLAHLARLPKLICSDEVAGRPDLGFRIAI